MNFEKSDKGKNSLREATKAAALAAILSGAHTPESQAQTVDVSPENPQYVEVLNGSEQFQELGRLTGEFEARSEIIERYLNGDESVSENALSRAVVDVSRLSAELTRAIETLRVASHLTPESRELFEESLGRVSLEQQEAKALVEEYYEKYPLPEENLSASPAEERPQPPVVEEQNQNTETGVFSDVSAWDFTIQASEILASELGRGAISMEQYSELEGTAREMAETATFLSEALRRYEERKANPETAEFANSELVEARELLIKYSEHYSTLSENPALAEVLGNLSPDTIQLPTQ